MVTIAKRTDNAFDHIYHSFTYGRKLIRKKVSKLQAEKDRIKRRIAKNKARRERCSTYVRHKKAKSIAGIFVPGEKHKFMVG